MIARRIAATRTRDADLAYRDPAQLLAELEIVQQSLVSAGANRHAYGQLQQFIWQVETFGFHLAELEVRQHSAIHRRVLAEIESGEPLSDVAEEALEVVRAIAQIQKRYGPRAAGRYIVSFTQSADDLADGASPGPRRGRARTALLRCSTSSRCSRPSPTCRRRPASWPRSSTNADFAARLDATDRRLEVMLGYSDSSKDVGPVGATLALYEAQREIAQWARDNDITLTLFHGRGGALGRGGGPANSAILAQPPHSVDGRFKLTEQGEVIFARYGDHDIAMRHIDQVAAAVLLASSPSIEKRNEDAATRFAAVAATMDTTSRARFFELVHAPGFAPWFATVTPMEEVGLLALGSRPARRGLSVESLEDLRAIPWVFSWTQARINLAGWFGLGSALDAVGDEALLVEAYPEWPLFRTMIDNVAMGLAKSDERIARHFLALGDRDDLAALVLEEMDAHAAPGSFASRAAASCSRTAPCCSGRSRCAAPTSTPCRCSSCARCAPCALRRRGRHADPELQRLLLLSVSGVAAGLQNTG